MTQNVERTSTRELLAGLIQNVDRGFDRVDGKIMQMDDRLDQMGDDIATLKEDMDKGFDQVNGRLDQMENDIATIKDDIKEIKEVLLKNK